MGIMRCYSSGQFKGIISMSSIPTPHFPAILSGVVFWGGHCRGALRFIRGCFSPTLHPHPVGVAQTASTFQPPKLLMRRNHGFYSRLSDRRSMNASRTASYASIGEKSMPGRNIWLTSPRKSASCIFSSRLAMNCL